jgi:K+-sensing histidine kinase KdpD
MLVTMADMRQPLQVVQTASQLLAQQPCVAGDEDGAFLVAAIASACRMLSGIVANVLSLRSLEAGDCVIATARFSPRGVVAGVLSVCRMSLAHRAGGASIRWANEADAPLPHTVLGDGDRLSQILLNLLTSARPHPPAHAPAFGVHVHRVI